MKIDSKKLSNALAALLNLTNKATTLPILNSVHLVAKNNTLEISASNLDCWQRAIVECNGELDSICLPARTLNVVLKRFTGEVELAADTKFKATLKGSSSSHISGMDGNDFPAFPNVKAKAIGLNTRDMADGIESVAWACAKEGKGRTNFEPVHVESKANKLQCTGTDGRYIARWERDAIAAECDFLLPAPFAKGVCDALRHDECAMTIGESYVCCNWPTGFFAAKLAEGNYPNCDPVLKQEVTRIGTIEKGDLISVLSTCAAIAPIQKVAATDIRFEDGFASVCFESSENRINENVTGKFKKSKEWAKVDASKLVVALRGIKADELEIGCSEETITLRGADTFSVIMGLRKS